MSIIKQILRKWFDLEEPMCESCRTLQMQLDSVNHERKQLLDTIIGFTRPAVEQRSVEQREIEPIKPKAIPWSVRRAELEKNARLTKEQMDKLAFETSQLENKVINEVDNAAGPNESAAS